MKYFSFFALLLILASCSTLKKSKSSAPAVKADTTATAVTVKDTTTAIDSMSIKKTEKSQDIYYKVYSLAIGNGDYNTAIQAIYYIMAKDPNNESYLDSLASLYYISGNYVQAVITGRKFLTTHPVDTSMLELVATAEQQLGRLKESLDLFQKLQIITGSPYFLYQVAVIQYKLKRYGECMENIDKMLNNPKSAKEQVQIADADNYRQNIPINAACLNLRGIVLLSMNQQSQAKKSFQMAIKTFPDFRLAKTNLSNMKNEKKK